MLGLVKVAVTGGLSCGKSSACRFFKELGAYVVSADEIVHQLLSPTTLLGKQVIQLIGPEIVVNHQIDRSIIAKKVFNNPKLLQALENLLHPAVGQELKKLYEQINKQGRAPLFVAEIPLLFESKSISFDYDYSVAVIADRDLCEQRFLQDNKHEESEFDKRSQRQLSNKEKAEKADFVIINNGSLEELKESVKKIFKKLSKPLNNEESVS
jgi:dephospho-CoA kinase